VLELQVERWKMMTNYAPEVEYFITPHCDHCDNTFVEGFGLVPVDMREVPPQVDVDGDDDKQWWCLYCCDQNGIEYNDGEL